MRQRPISVRLARIARGVAGGQPSVPGRWSWGMGGERSGGESIGNGGGELLGLWGAMRCWGLLVAGVARALGQAGLGRSAGCADGGRAGGHLRLPC